MKPPLRFSCCLLAVLSTVRSLAAAESLPAYRPASIVSGELRVWGAPADARLLAGWEKGFRKFHPDTRLVTALHGPESAMMGVYTGVADLALMGREMRAAAEFMAFTWALRYPPTLVTVAHAGADTARPNASLAVFVHAANPVARFTLAQLDGLFGAEHKRSPANLRTWGDVGLSGEWKDRPVHVLIPGIDHVSSLFFQQVVLLESSKWNMQLREFPDEAAVLAALAKDESGIAFGPLHDAPAGVRAVPLAATADGPAVALTPESIRARLYPLAREVTMVVRRAPGTAVDPRVAEFLRYILSADGQAEVAAEGNCLPLDPAAVSGSLKKIE